MKGLKWINRSLRLSGFLLLLLFVSCLFSSLFVVRNASAFDYNINLKYEKQLTSGGFTFYYKYGQNGTLESTSAGNLNIKRTQDPTVDPSPTEYAFVRYFCSRNSFSFTKGDLVLVTILTSATDTDVPIGSIRSYFSGDNFSIVDVSTDLEYDSIMSKLKTGAYQSQIPSGGIQEYAVEQLYYPYQIYSYDILLQANSTGNFPVCIGRSGGGVAQNLLIIPPADNIKGFTYVLTPWTYFRQLQYDNDAEEMNDKDNEDRENIENQQGDSQDSSDDSQEAAESTGTTLLAAFSSFVTAITNASPSNCNLLMNMGNLNLGNVNLCQLSPPPAFQAIGSIFLILFCVPLSIATARKVINLFRSFQS